MENRPAPALRPGDTLGPYKIESLLGQGGMGEVYRGTDTRLGRSIAVKVSAREFNDRFEREARAISALNHPNICTLYDVGPNYLVMELVEGDTLAQRIKQGPLPVELALQCAVQIADALAAAHAKGIVHRDLKPANIILTRTGVKVLDFGLAKLSPAAVSGVAGSSEVATLTQPLTGSGAVLGSLHYMSPEQVEAKEADERSDIFSFGVVFYEMLTGKRAFEGDTPAGVLAGILKDQPLPIQQLQPQAPRALDRVIRKCLEKKPADRWHSAHDLKQTLELIDLAAPVSTSGSGIQPQIPLPTRRRWLWSAVAVAAVIAAAGVAWVLATGRQAPSRVTRFETPLPERVDIDPNAFYVRVSPDGSKLAFTTVGEKAGIWVRDLEAVEARLLAGTAGVLSPFWSPDSKSLAYGAGRRLMRVDVSGGPPQVLCESVTNVGSGFWTKDGVIVFGGLGQGPLQRVSTAGGVPAPVTIVAPGENFHSLPSLLPDDKHFLYLSGSAQGPGLYVGSLDVKPEQQPKIRVSASQFGATFVRSSNSAGGHLFFLRDGTLMAQPFDTGKMVLTGEPVPVAQQIGTGRAHGHFSVTPGGLLAYRTGPGSATQLTWVDRQGRTVQTAGQPGTELQLAVTLSPDETQIALFRSDTNINAGDIFVLDRARSIETRLTFGQKVAMAPFPTRPVWSPDGKQIAYFSQGKLWAKPSNGAGDPRLLREVGHLALPSDWSRDGRFLIYYGAPGNSPSTLALPLTPPGGEPAVLIPGSVQAVLSPDGRWIAYTALESGQSVVYIQPFQALGKPTSQSGAKWQVSQNGGYSPRWRADGRELFFLTTQAVMAAGIEVSGDALRPSAPVQLFGISLVSPSQWDVSRDGQKFLVAAPLDRGSKTPITVVMNWEAALKR